MLKISCLHTAKSNIAVFEAARRALGLDDVMLKHRVRSDLLAAAEQEGTASARTLEHTAVELVSLGKSADGVLLTCSTLGPAAPLAAARLTAPVLRVDEALAGAAVRDGGSVMVLCATGTTLAPTRALFETAAIATGSAVEVRLVSGAWDLFRSGREQDYWKAIADAAELALADGVQTVALAQASMAGAADLVRSGQVLTSPGAGLSGIVARAGQLAHPT